MRRLAISLAWTVLGGSLVGGCLVDRSEIAAPIEVADTGPPPPDLDAALPPELDAALPPELDAALPLELDAALPLELDAVVPPGLDAFVEPPDAALVPDAPRPLDAWVVPPDAYAPPICTPVAETCNARDDDCNSLVDDGACGATTMGGGFVTCISHARDGRTYLACGFTARWDDARRLCKSFSPSYDLVAFTDAAENAAVQGWVTGNAWLGLTDSPSRVSSASDGDYRWVDESRPSFTNWGAGEPATDLTDGCVELTASTGQWDAASCDYRYYREVVCEAPFPM